MVQARVLTSVASVSLLLWAKATALVEILPLLVKLSAVHE